MQLTLFESSRNFLRSAECVFASVLAHAGLACLAVGMTHGGRQMPADEREARVFFLLPPDRVDVRVRQSETIRWGRIGGDLDDGRHLIPDEGLEIHARAYGARGSGKRSGARAELPFGPVAPYVPDTVFSVLEVDEIVQRYDGSAAPAYPRDLLALGAEGLVQMIYVVDSTGVVDTASARVIGSDDPRFTASVFTALGQMRFRPARRAGKPVRQLVQQQFRFQIVPQSQANPSRQLTSQ
jgi:TonB family protein